MTDKKEIYRVQAIAEKNPKQTAFALFYTAVFCATVFIVAKLLPASWFFQIAALVVSSLYINRVLKQGTFARTYVLYEDTFVIITRYGLIEKITGEFPLDKAVFTDAYIEYEGRRESFHPDEKLKKLLKIQITS